MKRSVIVGAFVALALLVGACTPDGPAPRTWKVSPQSVEVVKRNNWQQSGDRPYVIQVGFRSKLGVDKSTKVQVVSQCYNQKLPGENAVPAGTTYDFPAGAADVVFPEAQNLDLGDVLFNTAPLEIFGTMTFAMNRNVHPWISSCAMSDAFGSLLAPALRDALELLIADSSVPPTQDALIDLLVNNLGNFVGGIGSILLGTLEGLGTPDAIVGVGVQLLIPSAGAFTDLLNTAFSLAGFFVPQFQNGFVTTDELPASLKIKVGPLNASTTTFDFDAGDAGHYKLKMRIG